MNRTPILTALAFAMVFIVSCKNATTGLPIPKDAVMVLHINASSLSKKLTWKEIKETEWFREMYSREQDSFQKKIMDDPKNSGIDIKSDFAFFMKKQGKSGLAVFEGNLTDAKAFESTLKEINKGSEVQKDGELNYIKTGSDQIISWTGSKFIFISDANMNRQSYGDDYQSFGVDSLRKFTKELLALKSSSSLEKDEHFTTLLKEDGDIHFWMNMEQYYSAMGSAMHDNPVASIMGTMNKFFQGNIATGTINFDEGKISMKSKQYLGKEMAKIMDKYTFKPVPQDLINRIPSQNVAGALVINYPPEALKEFLKSSGIDGLANMYLGKLNYSLDELIQATKGQMIASFSDFNRTQVPVTMPGTEYTYNAPKTNFNALFAVSVNNKASFDKLLDVAKAQIEDSAERNQLLSKINYQVNNDWFAVSNNPSTVQGFLSGGNNNQPFAGKIGGHPFGMYIDIQKVMKGFESDAAYFKGMFDVSMNMWQDVVITGGDYKDGVSTGEFTINLVDKKTNALKQLNRYGQDLYAAQKKQQAEMMKKYQMEERSDTIVAPPAAEPNN